MKTLFKATFILLTVFISAFAKAQSFTATVQDANSGAPIPFATIQLSENRGTITNEEGVFAIDMAQVNKLKDSIIISSMGYEKISIFPKKATDTIIKLKVKVNELNNVFLTNNPLEIEEIIDRIKENLAKNYPNSFTKKKIFLRQSQATTMDKMEIEVEKTTIPEFNQAFMDSLLGSLPRQSDYYSESVSTLSGNYNEQKVFIEKAAKLYDKKKTGVGVNNFGNRLEEIVKKNVKRDSYFKIKSGIIGTKIQVDSTEAGDSKGAVKIEVDTDEDPTETDITASVKDDINHLYEAMFFQEDTALDFLTKSNRYAFTKREFTSIGDAIVYVIDFEPKAKKDFKGTFYVNTEDYAILRLEYSNVRKISSFGMFGISYKKFLYKGKSIYGKDKNGGYTLRYMELEEGVKFSLDRPLKIIEKNKNVKGRRKQNEVAMELEIANTVYEKKEFVVYDSAVIDRATFDSASDSKAVQATYLSAYDPAFWKGYTIMSPNAAIQAFKVVE